MKNLTQLFWMVFGYATAVFVATLVTVAIVVSMSTLRDQGLFGSYYKVTSALPSVLVAGLVMTTIYAFPGWLISIGIARWRADARKIYFIRAGAINAVFAHVLLSLGSSPAATMRALTGEFGIIVIWSVIGGLCGGWAYWRVAIIRFGNWKATQ